MRVPKGGWCIVYAVVACVAAEAGKEPWPQDRDRDVRKTIGEKTRAVDRAFEDGAAVAAKDVEIEVDEYGRELIPMKSVIAGKSNNKNGNNNVLPGVALPLEPDAEMLPAHYARVEPPGVDHMELRYADPETEESNVKPVLVVQRPSKQGTGSGAGDRHATLDVRVNKAGEKASNYERALKGEEKRRKEKGQRSEAGGKKKERFEEGKDSGQHQRSAGGKSGSDYRVRSNAGRAEKAEGFRKVYHKDERKKNADFYDNEDRGGKFKKHDRYKETFTVTEDNYKKGAAHNSGSVQSDFGKKGASERGQASQDAKSRDGAKSHAEFFKNLREYGKMSGSENGKTFRFAAKAR